MLCAAGSPVRAGVVEDAAEILREVEQDGPDRPLPRTSGPPHTVPSSSAPPVASPGPPSGSVSDSDSSDQPSATRHTGSGAGANPAVGEEEASDTEVAPHVQRRAFEQRVSGYLVLLLLLVIVAAAFIGRSLEGRSDDANDPE